MWLSLLVLFAALSPGVLFTIPSLGRKMGGKMVIAAMHALLFVIVVNLLSVVQEGFQVAAKLTTQQQLDETLRKLTLATDDLANVKQKVASAQAAYDALNKEATKLKAQLAREKSAATGVTATPVVGPARTATAASIADSSTLVEMAKKAIAGANSAEYTTSISAEPGIPKKP